MNAAPWASEPDTKIWEHAGLRCRITRHPSLKHLCGYVGVPEGHPAYRLHYSTEKPELFAALKAKRESEPIGKEPSFMLMIDALFKGEVTPCLASVIDVHGGVTYADADCPGHPDDGAGWWIGFDCNHCDDYAPGMPHFLAEHGTYRDLEYVTAQTNKLAEQLSALAA